MDTILLAGPDGPSAQVSTKAGELQLNSCPGLGLATTGTKVVPFFACKEPSRGENGRNAQRPDS
jgi:hypothetical protein